uniref:Putative secreted protein n=1 Tax=Amblyomma triste TaxID=251400 RepID=A0A023FZT5_AMBTT
MYCFCIFNNRLFICAIVSSLNGKECNNLVCEHVLCCPLYRLLHLNLSATLSLHITSPTTFSWPAVPLGNKTSHVNHFCI